jgi:uncharacterized protein YjiS (DUF1127 family)
MSVATAIYQETCHVCVVIKNKINAILKKVAEYQTRRASYWMLQNMTDRQLSDIGVSRSEIRSRVFDQYE